MDTGLVAFTVGLVVFWAIVYVVFRGRRGRVEVGPGYLIIRAGIRLDPMEAGWWSLAWRVFGVISLVLLVLSAIAFYYYTGKLFVLRYISPPPCAGTIAGFVPFIPGVTLSWKATVYIGVVLGIAALFHELSHAYVARSVGIRVRDAGLAFFLFIPAAFVEPDEEELGKARVRDRALVYSAGVGANVVLGLLFLALATSMVAGVVITGVEPGSPAARANLTAGMEILAVNGTRVESIGDLARVLSQLGAEDPHRNVTLVFTVRQDDIVRNVTVYRPWNKTAGNCTRARIGIMISNKYWPSQLLGVMSNLLFLINISLAVVNAAPLVIPLPGGSILSDGAYVLRDSLAVITGEKRAMILTLAVGVGTLLLILSLLSFQRIM
ncbi:MAG: site-2 protease family protein [Desulfurococcales archaeon]|nr:site-2 protease family protein [Desulfurococcales archaeon]